MKKWLSGLLALVLIVSLGTGCTQKEPPSGIYYDVTGIDPKSIAYKIGDTEFPAELYLYWISYTCNYLESTLNMYNAYYGAYGELFDENGELQWDGEEFMDSMNLTQYAKQQAEDTMRFYASIENKAKELGVELNDADRAELEEEFAAAVEQFGGEDAFLENMELMGISRESFDRISGDALLFEKMLDMVMEEGSAIYLAAEEYEKRASYTDHILLSTQNSQTDEPLSEEEAAQKLETAQSLLEQLKNAEDTEALFDQLAAEYSEDPGRAAENGYLVTEDSNFVPEFLETALALKPGEVSDIVESTYGYHILYRRELSEDHKAAIAEEHLYTLLDETAENSKEESTEQIDAIDAGEFYTSYNAKVAEIQAAKAAEDDVNGTDGTEGTENSGGSGDDSAADSGTDTADTGDGDAQAEGAGE